MEIALKALTHKIQDGEWCGRDRANMVEESLGDMQHEWNMACQSAIQEQGDS